MRDTYIPGGYWVICDLSGWKCRASDTVKQWNGLRVKREFYEPRNPQDFVRAVRDSQSVPDPRPEATDSFQSIGLWWFQNYDQSGEILTLGL